MFARREMLGTTGLAGLMASFLPASGPAEPQGAERAMADVAAAIDNARKRYESDRTFPELAGVRDQVRTFVRAAGKFPDFVDVGFDVWQGLYDWHVRWHQPLSIARDPNGRYVMAVLLTNVVLRHDALPGYISTGYDAK